MNLAAANLDGHALAARYEVLRNDAVASADRRHTLHSLALLMRKGMAAWINDIGEEPPVREGPASLAIACPRAFSAASSILSPPWLLQRHWRVCHEFRYPVQSPGATP